MSLLMANLATICVGLLVVAVCVLAVLRIRKDHKNGTACGCGCKECPSSTLCHKQ